MGPNSPVAVRQVWPPPAFDSEAEAREAATAFNDQRCTFEPNYDNTVLPLEKEGASQWNMETL